MPEHGLVSCRALDPEPAAQQGQQDAEDNDAQRLAEGSECTVSCRPPHRLQLHANHSAVTRCQAGHWNVSSWLCVRGNKLTN